MARIKKLQDKMAKTSCDAVLISSEINQRYLTGFPYTDGYVLVLRDTAYLLADFRYIEAARAAVSSDDCQVVMPDCSMVRYVASLLEDHKVNTLLYEEETLSCAMFERFREFFPKAVTLTSGASGILNDLRIFKDADEIECIKRAQKITDDAFSHILNYITPERTEIDVALELEFFMRSHGSEGTAFETIAVSGKATALPHGVPRPVKLEKGFFTMDFGARVDGYCADMTRTIVLGKADEDMKRLYNTVLRAQRAALDAAHEGIGCAEMDKIARDIIDEGGYKGCFGHSLGHGVGLYVHENPRFASSVPANSTFSRGNVVTVEPGIYMEGKYGCRIEDMITVLSDGTVYNFTKSPKELIEL